MNWIVLAVLSARLYGGYHFFIKLASSHINQVLAAVILQASALVVGIVLLAFLKYRGETIAFSSTGARLAILGGLSVGIGEILAFYVFSRGIPVSHGAPIIIGGTVAATALYGMSFLRESLAPVQWLGFSLIILGIVILTSFERAG